MRLTRNQLKELIRKSIEEMDFKNQAAFDAYNNLSIELEYVVNSLAAGTADALQMPLIVGF